MKYFIRINNLRKMDGQAIQCDLIQQIYEYIHDERFDFVKNEWYSFKEYVEFAVWGKGEEMTLMKLKFPFIESIRHVIPD